MASQEPSDNTNGENPILGAYARRAGAEDSFRRAVNEIVRSYRHSWDVFGELLQNSVDAINRRGSEEPAFNGEIRIKIDREGQTITVIDNGCGIESDKLAQAVAPGESFKTLGKDYGYKGYGLTFVCFVSKTFEISSTNGSATTSLKMSGNIDWLGDETLELPTVALSPGESGNRPSGTSVNVKLACGDYGDKFRAVSSLDRMFEWASKPKPLEYVLRTRTAVGNTGRAFDKPPRPEIKITIEMNGEEHIIPYEYLLPTESSYAKQSTYTTPEYATRFADGQLSNDAKRFRALVDKTSGNVGKDGWLNYSAATIVCGRVGMTRLASDFDVDSDALIETSTGFYLALNGMPTGIQLTDDRQGGFEQRYFVIVDADLSLSDQLDSGRKGISPYYADLLVKSINAHIASPVVDQSGNHLPNKPSLRTYASMMLDPGNDPESDRGMRDKYLEHESLGDLELSLALKKVPDDENEVIALFSELLGRGFLPGYQTIFLSQSTRYDAVFKYTIDLNDQTVYADADPNSLGVGGAGQNAWRNNEATWTWDDPKGVQWFAAEFKTRVQDILTDKRFRQSIDDLTLLIAWDADEEKIRSTGALLDKIRPISRPFYGVTHELTYHGTKCYCMLLKDVIHLLAAKHQ